MIVPKLSVCMITFNHEPFIREAIESVMMQKTNFEFELVIGEDNSTDNTRSICIELQKKYPNKLRLLPIGSTLGMMPNFVRTYNECKGELIALCEGDDYWTAPLKLQKQVDSFQEDNNISFNFHIGDLLYENDKLIHHSQDFKKFSYSFKDFAAYGCFIKTMSVVFINNAFLKNVLNQQWVLSLSGVDQLLYLLLTLDGKISKSLNYHWGIYRVHSGGIWSSADNVTRSKRVINDIRLYKKHLKLNFKHSIYLNWQLRIHLINILYFVNSFKPKFLSRLTNVFINRLITLPGPGFLSSLLTEVLYSLLKSRYKAIFSYYK